MINNFMNLALEEAYKAFKIGEVPVGAIIVDSKTKEVIARGHNLVESYSNPTFHAELLAINEACKLLGEKHLLSCDIYVTLEPCAMCAAAISYSRIKRLFYGASDSKSGGIENGVRFFTNANCHYKPEIYPGIKAEESSKILTDFFKALRK